MTSDTSIEEGQIVTETDMPPLTGAQPRPHLTLHRGLSCIIGFLRALHFNFSCIVMSPQFLGACQMAATNTRYPQLRQNPHMRRTGRCLTRKLIKMSDFFFQNEITVSYL